MDRLEQMRAFVTIVEAGGISAAAERLNVAKSAVSRRLAELERSLGVQLLTRTTRSQALTPTGEAFLERARGILADVEELESSVASEQRALRGGLRVAAPLTFGLHHLTPALTEFLGAHPGIELELDLNDRRIDLVQEGFDVAIRIGELEDSTLVARRLAAIRHVVCASPGYLEAHGEPSSPEDLREHEVLQYSNLRQGSWRFERPDGSTGAVTVRPSLRANNGDFLLACALAGRGIAMQPTFVVHDALRNGTLVPLLTDHRWMGIALYAIYPQTRHLSLRVRALIDHLLDRFGGTPAWERDLPPFA